MGSFPEQNFSISYFDFDNEPRIPMSAFSKLESPEQQSLWNQSIKKSEEKGSPQVSIMILNFDESMIDRFSSHESNVIPSEHHHMAEQPISAGSTNAPLIKCSCKPTKCANNRCPCFRANKKCTYLCVCKQCQNHGLKKETFFRGVFEDFGHFGIKLNKRKTIRKI